MEIFDTIKSMAETTANEELLAAAKKTQGIMGYFCSYVPEEIIHAAGFIPYRMRAVASRGTQKGDIYFAAINCTFVRNCFDKALREDFSFLKGIVFMNGCDHTRRLYDNWRHADLQPDFRYMFTAPHVINALALEDFTRGLHAFIHGIEEHYGLTITEESLSASILLYNRKRELLEKLYALRKQEEVPIHGSEMLRVILAVTSLPIEKGIEILEEVLTACHGRRVNKDEDLRLFLTGGCMEEPAHLEMIEESGGVIVADNLCLGRRHFDTMVDTGEEPVQALAARYLSHLSCPRIMNDFFQRLQFLNTIRHEYRVDAVIAEKLKFCDLWGGEIFILRKESAVQPFPLLALERELYGNDSGQVKTRVQAFFEQVRNKREIKNRIYSLS